MPARYCIGIDLGTTNCAVSYIDTAAAVAAGKAPQVQSFLIAQLVTEGHVADRPLLPSFLYMAGDHDLPVGSLKLPWEEGRRFAVGEFARNQGAKVPGRLVQSAKSWLCHAAVDRTADILPWGSVPDVTKVSPVEASARTIAHMKEAWNARMAASDPDRAMEKQDVVLTVPASFDAVARELTVEAAKRAGLTNITLLEEPQAAFYWWIVAHFENWWSLVRPGNLVLVCDVGGGTTDFSLIAVKETKAGLGFERFAVGDHLILGGDNMDVALARRVEQRLSGGKPAKLDNTQWSALVQLCRAAKETLLSTDAVKVPVVLPGRGSSVIGGSLRSELTRQEVHETVIDGFFPATKWDEDPVRTGRTGLQEFGLPFAGDAAIPRHLSAFLRKHLAGAGGRGVGARGRVSAVLFNGGVFNPPIVRDRLVTVMRDWVSNAAPFGEIVSESPEHPHGLSLTMLDNRHLDLAVAHGAAYYGLVRRGQGIRIAGGTARSYYVGIGGADVSQSDSEKFSGLGEPPASAGGENRPLVKPEVSPGADAPGSLQARGEGSTTVLCVVPAGLEEGKELEILDRKFELLTGRPVGFPIFSSSLRPADKAGAVMTAEEESLVPLAPIRTVLTAGKKGGAKTVPVHLKAKLTEVGTLELWCVSETGDKSWRLQFAVRGAGTAQERVDTGGADDVDPTKPASSEPMAVFDENLVGRAVAVIRSAFGLPGGSEPAVQPASLNRKLEEALEMKRGEWPTGLLRRMWDPLFEAIEKRKLGPEHEARWLNLAGYVLRPGFGDPLDDWRIKRLLSIQYTGLTHFKHPQCWVEWWTLWRRVAGGLAATHQAELLQEAAAYLHPSIKRGKGPRPGRAKTTAHELNEVLRVAASLERLEPAIKERIGEAVFIEAKGALPPPTGLWALARVGARSLIYGPVNMVASRDAVERWVGRLLALPWTGAVEPAGLAISQMARRTEDRVRDIDDDLRQRVVERLHSEGGPRAEHFIKLATEAGETADADRGELLGDELPPGLRLVGG